MFSLNLHESFFTHKKVGTTLFFQFGLQVLVFCLQLLFRFAPRWVEWNATDRAHLLALRLVEMADAFSAFIRVNLVDFRPHINRFVWAFRLANVAIDTVVGD
jgi:hypothetical protein